MKIRAADLYRTLLEHRYDDEDEISVLCREMEEITIDDNLLYRD